MKTRFKQRFYHFFQMNDSNHKAALVEAGILDVGEESPWSTLGEEWREKTYSLRIQGDRMSCCDNSKYPLKAFEVRGPFGPFGRWPKSYEAYMNL